jgi:hypothetical protein
MGIVNSGNLKVRSKPDLDSAIVGQLQTGDTVVVLERSETKIRIDDMKGYWYYVVKDALEGWAYGYFVSRDSIEFPDNEIIVYTGYNINDPLEIFYHIFSII